MLRIVFDSEDLGRVRIAGYADPMWELVLSLFRMRRPQGALVFDGWRQQARRKVPASTRLLTDLVPPAGNFADFITPMTTNGTMAAKLDAILATGTGRLVTDLTELAKDRPAPQWFSALAQGDRPALTAVSTAARSYFDACLAPHWPRVESSVAQERVRLTRVLVESGVEVLLRSLHPAIRWEPPELLVDYPVSRVRRLGGRGLVLMPGFFCWGKPTSFRDPDCPPVLIYPIQHELGWALPRPAKSLTALLGSTRATLLDRVCVAPDTTTGLARSTETSPATVSEQTAILRDAGLISTRRCGRSVVHSITPLGIALLNG